MQKKKKNVHSNRDLDGTLNECSRKCRSLDRAGKRAAAPGSGRTRARAVVVGTLAHLFGKSMIAGRRTGVRAVFPRVPVVSGAIRPPARNRRETRRPGGDFSAKKCTGHSMLFGRPPPTLRRPASRCVYRAVAGGRRRPNGFGVQNNTLLLLLLLLLYFLSTFRL